ncbi:MAG: AAA family ATPase [Gammaproteobacteria bacterium]|nr:AAA family ATPase [Gammaproteobacteria bacterium]
MNKIILENFRCFREKQDVRLAPLTLLVGDNSTGKTSFLALIRALCDVAFREIVPDFKEEPYDLGSFDEIAHHRGAKGSRADSFEAGFELASKNGAFDFVVTFQQGKTAPVVVKRHLSHEAMWVEEDNSKKDKSILRFSVSSEQPKELKFTGPRHRVTVDDLEEQDRLAPLGWQFRRLIWAFEENPSKSKSLSKEITQEEAEKIRDILKNFERFDSVYSRHRPYASAPVRSKPRRTYDPMRITPDPEGDHIPMYLAHLRFRSEGEWRRLKDALEKFGKDTGLFDEISIRPLGKKETEPFQLQIRKSGGKLKGPYRNLIDVGYGVNQVLPIITELLRLNVPRMFLMQQPEVHLHPSAQAALGSLFCKLVGARRHRFVVETHSDYLLDRVRMDVRDNESKLKPEDVSILFFERGDLDVKIHSLQLDKEGQVIDAPASYRKFFMDEVNRRLKL